MNEMWLVPGKLRVCLIFRLHRCFAATDCCYRSNRARTKRRRRCACVRRWEKLYKTGCMAGQGRKHWANGRRHDDIRWSNRKHVYRARLGWIT